MIYYERDYHGWKVNAALRDIENFLFVELDANTTLNVDIEICLITGQGKIRDAIEKYISDNYECQMTIPDFNQGCIILRIYDATF